MLAFGGLWGMLERALSGQIGFQDFIVQFLGLVIAASVAITVHEFAHAKAAEAAGDPTPRANGRISLNPLDHYDPIGSTLFLLVGLGWAKPVPVNPHYFRHPRRDDILVALWGPLSNLLTAAALGALFRVGRIMGMHHALLELLVLCIFLNLFLAFFNLIPIYPLDGSHVLLGLLPLAQAQKVEIFYQRAGLLLIILLMVTPLASWIVFTPATILFTLFTGV